MKISCIDIGGTYIKSGVLEDGVLTGVEETPTDGGGGARAMLSRVAQLVRQTPGVERVGVSTAGEVDARTGVIRLSDNIPGYTGLNPRQILEGELGLPVAVENDVNAAAAGEFAFGAARDEQDFLMVSYGTGVGGAVYIGGRLYRGRAGSAGEFGGLVTHPEAVDPARQGTGSYERYASTSALVARVTALYPALTTGRDIFAHLNDPTIKKEVDAWIREVACGIISLIHAFDPALVVLGGGIIGLEMACVYDALGTRITVVELMDQIIPGADKDIVKPLHKRIEGRYEKILLKTRVTDVKAGDDGLTVTFEDEKGATTTDMFDRLLVAVGRRPNGKLIGAEAAGVAVDERGFIAVDSQQRTNVPHIFAIGDVVGQPMLAHKAVHEGKVAAEVAAGQNRHFDARVIPSVAYTDPEVAWVGVTEAQAKAEGRKIGKGVFPWAASGRSLSLGRSEGITKVIFDEADDRVIGACIVGPNAGDLIAEVALAIEMGADAVDLGHTIHPHPTLSETVNFAAEMFEGTITDLIPPKKRH